MHVIQVKNPGDALNPDYKSQFMDVAYDHDKLKDTVSFTNLQDMLKDAIIYAARNPNFFVPVVQAYFRGTPLGVDMALRVSNQACVQLTRLRADGEDSLAFENAGSVIEGAALAIQFLNQNIASDEASALAGRNMIEVQFTNLEKVINTLVLALDSAHLEHG